MSIAYESGKSIAFRHGFFTRQGGVSPAPYDSLNVTTRNGDDQSNVATNRDRALQALRLQQKNLAFLDHLEHSDRILSASKAAAGLEFNGYDAIITNESELAIGICVADCPVIFLASEEDGVIGLAHSGWRGTHANVVPKTIEAMVEEFGIDPSNLKAVIGPAIQVQHYEVGKDVAEMFDGRYVHLKNEKYYLNFLLAIEDQLYESGVREIENLDIDTYSDERFFSYRRDDGDTGRNFVVASM